MYSADCKQFSQLLIMKDISSILKYFTYHHTLNKMVAASEKLIYLDTLFLLEEIQNTNEGVTCNTAVTIALRSMKQLQIFTIVVRSCRSQEARRMVVARSS